MRILIKIKNIIKDIMVKKIVLNDKQELKNLILDWNLKGYSVDKMNKLIKGYDYSSITDFSYLFYEEEELFYLPKLDTSNVTKMNCAFYNCTNVKRINLNNTSNVVSFNSTFFGCANLEEISDLDTSKTKDLICAFFGCDNLTPPKINNTGSKILNVYFTARQHKDIYIKMHKEHLFDDCIVGIESYLEILEDKKLYNLFKEKQKFKIFY